MSSSKLRVISFTGYGRGELVRLVLAASGVDFEDIRYTREEWPEHKKTAPAGSTIPYVDSPSEKCSMVQSGAIVRYFARKGGLMGSSDWEYYLTERTLCQVEDVFMELLKIMSSPEDKRAEMLKEFQAGKGQQLLTTMVKFLKDGGSGFYAGKSVTAADLASITLLDNLGHLPDLLAKFPELAEHRDRVIAANAKVADWIKRRP